MSKTIIIIILLFISSEQSLAFRKGTDDSSTMNECLWNKKALGRNSVECNDLYHHYRPKSESYEPTEELRVGSYNIFRTSEQKSRKNLDLTSEMIDAQWDLVALQELQPGRTDDIRNSHKEGADYIYPAYLDLLLKLQEKDESWALILSPYSQGSDAELLGFMYRARVVKPQESNYCKTHYLDDPPYTKDFVFRELYEGGIQTSRSDEPVNDRDYVLPSKALACPLRLSDLANRYFIKVPLTARFKSGDFESSYVTLHLSFRGIEEFDSKCMGLCQLQNIKLISSLEGKEDNNIALAIDDLLEQEKTKKMLAGTENKIPPTNDRCQIDERKFKKDPDREQSRFDNCVERLDEQIQLIKSNDLLPRSCVDLVENVNNPAKYEACIEDYENLRDDTYKKFIRNVFKTIVFNEYPKVSKKSSQNMEEFYDEAFANGVVAGMYSLLGRDSIISMGEGREFARFYQVYSVMRAAEGIRSAENSTDIVISGDFNLEKETKRDSWHYRMWNHSLALLGDAEIYIDGLTSINSKRKLSNSYDHFIFSPSETDECDSTSPYILNFLTDVLDNGFEIGKAVQKEEYHFVMSDHLPIGMICSSY